MDKRPATRVKEYIYRTSGISQNSLYERNPKRSVDYYEPILSTGKGRDHG